MFRTVYTCVAIHIGFIVLCTSLASAQQTATTEDGRKVKLHEDKTWEYKDADKDPKQNKGEKSDHNEPSDGQKNAATDEASAQSEKVKVPNPKSSPDYDRVLTGDAYAKSFKRMKPALKRYYTARVNNKPMSALRSRSGACVSTSLGSSTEVDIDICLVKGRPKTLNDDKKPRVRVILRSSSIDLVKPGNYQLTFLKNGNRLIKKRMSGPSPDTSNGNFVSYFEKELSGNFSAGDEYTAEIVAAFNTDLTVEETMNLRLDKKIKGIKKRRLDYYMSNYFCAKKVATAGLEYHLCSKDKSKKLHIIVICDDSVRCPLWRRPGAVSINGDLAASWNMMSSMKKLSRDERMIQFVDGVGYTLKYGVFKANSAIQTASLKITGGDTSTQDLWPVKVKLQIGDK